jgi:hypothetical protein
MHFETPAAPRGKPVGVETPRARTHGRDSTLHEARPLRPILNLLDAARPWTAQR